MTLHPPVDAATIIAQLLKGGGCIVEVYRDGIKRRYRASLPRYNRLYDMLMAYPSRKSDSYFSSHGFGVLLTSVSGLRAAKGGAA